MADLAPSEMGTCWCLIERGVSGGSSGLTCRPVKLGSALNQFGLDQFMQAMSDTPEAPTPLAPEEEVELNRLCEEYAVATAAVRKNMRFGNPPEPGQVLIFVSQKRAQPR